jgi:hypothetical protein
MLFRTSKHLTNSRSDAPRRPRLCSVSGGFAFIAVKHMTDYDFIFTADSFNFNFITINTDSAQTAKSLFKCFKFFDCKIMLSLA